MTEVKRRHKKKEMLNYLGKENSHPILIIGWDCFLVIRVVLKSYYVICNSIGTISIQ